jgi:dCTP deaminase
MLSGNEITWLQNNPWYEVSTPEQGVVTPSLSISPFDHNKVNPNSYNLSLHKELLVYVTNLRYVLNQRTGMDLINCYIKPYSKFTDFSFLYSGTDLFDTAEEPEFLVLTIPPEGIDLHPDILYIGATNEITKCVNLVPAIEGRSSVARAGISVHQTAGFGDNGYHGAWTLEIRSSFPTRVYAGSDICQICFHEIGIAQHDLPCSKDVPGPRYKGKYQGSTGPKATGWWKDFIKKN